MSRTPIRRLATVAAAAAAGVLGGAVLVGTVLAQSAPQFSDVPPNHPFADEVEAIADAGITTGFADGTYRPGAPVSRGAMAAFMGRGFGRAVGGTSQATLGGGSGLDSAAVASATVPAGAAQSGNGYVLVTASATVVADDTDGGDGVSLRIFDEGGIESSAASRATLPPATAAPALGGSTVELSQTWVFPLAADESSDYTAIVEMTDPGLETDETTVHGSISALYVPFGQPSSP